VTCIFTGTRSGSLASFTFFISASGHAPRDKA
jgi:hypothetical protein